MKIWYGYGSEHSMNLVMVGHFRDEDQAKKAKWMIEQIQEFVQGEVDAGRMEIGSPENQYSDRIRELLERLNFFHASPAEFDQLGYDFSVKQDGTDLVLTTDEVDVSMFLKLFVHSGARVEVYSAHEYPDTDYGRGKSK
jgi:hypothetical protein